jgi:hypothetical protein
MSKGKVVLGTVILDARIGVKKGPLHVILIDGDVEGVDFTTITEHKGEACEKHGLLATGDFAQYCYSIILGTGDRKIIVREGEK